MEKPEQITTVTELLDRIDRMREELVAVQRFLEKMEPVEPSKGEHRRES